MRKERYYKDQRGQGLTEYAMLMGLVAIVCVAFVAAFSDVIQDTFYAVIAGTMESL